MRSSATSRQGGRKRCRARFFQHSHGQIYQFSQSREERILGYIAFVNLEYIINAKGLKLCAPLIKVGPNMNNKDHDKQYGPTGKGAYATGKSFRVKNYSDDNRSCNLGEPVNQVIQRSGPDIENRIVVVVEF